MKSSRPYPLQSITPGPDIPWQHIGPGESHLLAELEKLYWIGVEHELQNIIYTLREWQRPENSHISVPDEKDDWIYGFDTFIDQVCLDSREFASRYEKRRRREDTHIVQEQKYEDALQQVFLDTKAERNAMRIKEQVRDEIKHLPNLNGLELRACMLLQAAGFLDIDQVIEDRPTAKGRPRIPQLTLSINETSQPEFHPLHCSACNTIIYDSMFTKLPPTPSLYTICSDCYWTQHHGDSSFVKVHQHSILHAIDDPTSRRLCQCDNVPHADSSGRPRSLFPLNSEDRHITAGKLRCPLLDLPDLVAHAKYRGLIASMETKPRGSGSGAIARVIERVKSIRVGRGERSSSVTQAGTGGFNDMDHMDGPPVEDDIPAFFRRWAEKDSFGDMHMALRIGPLVIENGVESAKAGALITLREPPVFHERFQRKPEQPALTIDGSDRLLWQQLRPAGQPKRYNGIMKQVVGVPFSGLVDAEHIQEQEIIQRVLEASQSGMEFQQETDSRISHIIDKLQALLAPRVKTYLSSIASQLLSPSTTLTWNPATNNCHSFCTSLLDPTLFTPLVNGPPTDSSPLYLLSFFSSPQPHKHSLTPAPKTKHDIPPGHIEESLIHNTLHTDLIDTLTHYSTDWASFPRPLYPNQSLFPWDCTEGYARCAMTCGGCNMAKHVWAFPFDSWSLVSMHLGREKGLYSFLTGEGEYNYVALHGVIHTQTNTQNHKHTGNPETNSPTSTSTATEIPPTEQWTQNRLSILSASWVLARGAAGMARSPAFKQATAWMHHHPRDTNQTNPNPILPVPTISISRAKKGGIHRAQPNSHFFELGTHAHFFLAAWAGKRAPEQRREYEALRAARMKMEDVLVRGNGRFSQRTGFGNTASRSGTKSGSKSGSQVQRKGDKKKKKDAGTKDRSYAGFEGEDSTRFTGNSQLFYNASYTPGSGSSGVGVGAGSGEGGCVDAQFGGVIGHCGMGSGYDPATDPGVNCATGCGSSSMPSGGGDSGHGGGGGGGHGGWGDGGGHGGYGGYGGHGGYGDGGGYGGGSGDGGGGSSGGGDGGGGGC